jgi:hypothetical protein
MVAMVSMMTVVAQGPSPWLERRSYWVGEVEQGTTELWTRLARWWCYDGGVFGQWLQWRWRRRLLLPPLPSILAKREQGRDSEGKREQQQHVPSPSPPSGLTS